MRRRVWLVLLLFVAGLARPAAAAAPTDAITAALNRMVDEEVVGAGIKSPRVIAAMRATPRQEFMPAKERRNAFFDMALPIGHGQSISPPFVVAFMTEKIDPLPDEKVLEIGTGSGYQAAVLSPLARDVYTIEIVEPLGKTAAATLERLGYKNVHTRVGDGYLGWPEEAPFDKIIVTCSPEKVPQALVDQLREGGRLIVPVGERFQQTLYLFTKKQGKLVAQALEPTMFVPMTGEAERLRVVKPDPTKPVLTGGSFERVSSETGFPEGWYYIRHAEVEADPMAPDEKQVITFTNDVPGRSARALQAFGIDGRAVSKLDVALWVKARHVKAGDSPDQVPQFFISFFDDNRAPCGQSAFGGWTGTFSWRREQGSFKVPPKARMAIVWIGLLGATGEVSFDGVSLSGEAARPSAGSAKPTAPLR
ncbi:MAG: protein-L-isoaspartate(D-aspartate) O-methyltransferase [Planctomycetia bacterium]|nr:protein-L-isoaspartate(D-aspartate) O-methyltransferase [Planctomycetia bacterium]